MLRASFCSFAVLALFVIGLARADDAKSKGDKNTKHTQATITTVDAEKNTVTVTIKGRKGKEVAKTFQVPKGAKYFDSTGKVAKLDAFKPGDDIVITQKGGKITEMRIHAEATITKVDAKEGTVTVKMMDKEGKEVEKTFKLMEDVEYIDTRGRVASLDVFQSGDQVLLIESEGKIKELKKNTKHNKTGDKHVSAK
jgi:hypothetical protein